MRFMRVLRGGGFLRLILLPFATIHVILKKCLANYNRRMLNVYYMRKFSKVGSGLSFSPADSTFQFENTSIGDRVFIGRGADFQGKLEIGNDVMFGPYVYISDGRHLYEQVGKTMNKQARSTEDQIAARAQKLITIGNDCWIGERSFLYGAKLTIGEGCVIGAMSVVTKDTPPYTVCVGNPCRPIKKRYTDEELHEHLLSCGKTESDISHIIASRNKALLDEK